MKVRMSASHLEQIEWAHTSRTFQALGHRFAFRSTDPEMGRFVDELYGSCAIPGEPATWYSIVHSISGTRELYVDGERLVGMDRASRLVRYITWHVNHEVIKRTSDLVLLHAAAAAQNGVGVILPGVPEAGKTTLVAGLVRSGFQYLTDEAAAIDPATLEIEPYPKPLTIDQGSWPVLSDLAPAGAGEADGYHGDQWHVRPQAIRLDAISGRVSADLIIFPRFESGASTVLEPVRRPEVLIGLLRQTFRLHDRGRRNLETLAAVVRPATCYRLTSGDLDEACELVAGATDRALTQKRGRIDDGS